VIDYETLGKLYLGRELDAESGEPTEIPMLYASKDLTTHAFCVGMTGSGKTGLCITLLEEAAIDGIPALCIDPKGDLGNLLLTFPELAPSDFEPWVDPAEAEKKGRSVAEHAEAVAENWREGLRRWGQDGKRIARLRDTVDLAIYTPGSSAGQPLRVLEAFTPPVDLIDPDAERDQIMAAVSSLLSLVGIDPDPVSSREHILLSNLLGHAWSLGEALDLADLVRAISDPPFERVGVMELEAFYPASERQKLATRVNGVLASPGFSAWLEGEPLDVQRLLWTEEGKPRVSVLSIAHLSEAERMFFVSALLGRVVSWMRRQSGTPSLRALIYMDEVFGFLPPVAQPPSKRPLLTLLKQARAYGVGLVLATQNPVDVDYKALSNCGTWFLGRLQTERDVARVIDGLLGTGSAAGHGIDRNKLETLLAGLSSRVFLLKSAHQDGLVLFETRWAMSYLRGPMTRQEIKRLSPKPSKSRSVASPDSTDGSRATPAIRPVLPAGIEEAFVDQGAGIYRPYIVATVSLHYVRAAHGLDEWEIKLFVVPLDESSWNRAELRDLDEFDFVGDAPNDVEFVELPPRSVGKARFRRYRTQIRAHLYQSRSRALWRCKAPKLLSKPGETKAEFAARVQLAEREARDAAVEKLRNRFAKKVERLEDRMRRAKARVELEEDQYEQQKLQAGISMGATLLGAIFGRGSLGRATTTARGAGRVAREREDVARARQALEELRQEQRDLEIEIEEELRVYQAEQDAQLHEIEELIIRPRKSDIEVSDLKLVWMQR
jgi:DNA helicase HerA-like ATPase